MIHKITNAIWSRFFMLVIGSLIIVFGVIVPQKTMRVLKHIMREHEFKL